jgi:hypothetical protein
MAKNTELAKADTATRVFELYRLKEAGKPIPEGENKEALDVLDMMIRHTANAAIQTEHSYCDLMFGDKNFLKVSCREQLHEMVKDLAGPNASQAVKLLAHRAAICWLAVQYAETRYAQRLAGSSMNWENSNGYQKDIDRAHKRFMSAMKTLAIVQRLTLPNIQVNIAENQVNLLHPGDKQEAAA